MGGNTKNSPVKWWRLSLSFTTKHNLLAFLQRVHWEYDAARLLGDNGSLQYIVHCQRKGNKRNDKQILFAYCQPACKTSDL